jgi:site-specific DNA-cytosine methylase
MSHERDTERDTARTVERDRQNEAPARGIEHNLPADRERFILAAIARSERSHQEYARHLFGLTFPKRDITPPDLLPRLERDVEIYKSIEGLSHARWEQAHDIKQRIGILQEMEDRIAADQGRPSHTVIATSRRDMPAKRVLAATSIPIDYWMDAEDLKGKSQQDIESYGKLRTMLIDPRTVMKQPLHTVFVIMAEEIFHAYQFDVLERPSAHPVTEVAIDRRAYWSWARQHHARFAYHEDPIEIDAKVAAEYEKQRLFG